MKLLLGLIFFGVSLTATSASACRFFEQPAERIERARDEGIVQGVAVVAIERARPVDSNVDELRPWRASARVLQSIEGSRLPVSVEFERGWGSAACEGNQPALPEAGDTWVVYFWRDRSGALRPWLEMTLAEARKWDRRLVLRSD